MVKNHCKKKIDHIQQHITTTNKSFRKRKKKKLREQKKNFHHFFALLILNNSKTNFFSSFIFFDCLKYYHPNAVKCCSFLLFEPPNCCNPLNYRIFTDLPNLYTACQFVLINLANKIRFKSSETLLMKRVNQSTTTKNGSNTLEIPIVFSHIGQAKKQQQ